MTTTTTKTRKSTKPCPACGGSGKLTGGESPSENLPCPECEGDGEVPAVPMSTNSAAALRAGYRNIVERRQTPEYMPVEMRSVDNGTGGQALLFTGYASVTERGYEMVDKFGEYTETIDRSAFDRTLADGCDTVVLSGGSFQNRRLAASTRSRLEARGLRVLEHRLVPPNDGGVSYGQAAVAARRLACA